jgi:CBS domain-containing protein
MKCYELMRTPVYTCFEHERMTPLAERMRDHEIGFLPVCDAHGTVTGTITDRDLVIRVLAARRSTERTCAAEVMTRGAISCVPGDDIELAENLMARYRKSRIVCVDDELRPVGVISLSDIAQVDGSARTARLLSAISTREAQPKLD